MVTLKPRRRRKISPQRRKVRRRIGFKGIRKLNFREYRDGVRHLYDGPAGAVLALGSLISLHEPLVGHLLRSRRFDVTARQTILDVGSGAGQILGHLLKETGANTRLIAFDLSHQMLRRARQRLKSDRPVFVSGDLTRMPFEDESFDCITCGWVLEHLPDPQPGLAEIERVLRPGGSALILATEDTFSGLMTSFTWKCRTYNRSELQKTCESVGLPWEEQLWFTRIHRFFKMGGILVKATKPEDEERSAGSNPAAAIPG